ncbi:MAG TPA: sugar ABC transporter permease [Spirochaetia bacterium]|nr:sugar ABC transporter permease [Spirochaetia bacterium]
MSSTVYAFGSRKSRFVPYLLLLPGLLLYLFISLGPSIATSVYSFTDASGLVGAPIHWVGLDNYKEFLFRGVNARDNWEITFRTLKFAFLVTVVQTAFGLLAAVLLNQRLGGRNVFRTIYFMPVILGVTIIGLMWTLFLYPLGGPAEKLLNLLGTRSDFIGGPPSEAFLWIVWVQIWANMGTTMIIFLGGLQTIQNELHEAARIDGAGGWTTFRRITFPLLTPSLNTNLLLNIIGSLQAWQLMLVIKGPTNGLNVLGIWIYALAFGRQSNNPTQAAMRQGYGAAASVLLFALVLVVGLTAQYLIRRRERRLLE